MLAKFRKIYKLVWFIRGMPEKQGVFPVEKLRGWDFLTI